MNQHHRLPQLLHYLLVVMVLCLLGLPSHLGANVPATTSQYRADLVRHEGYRTTVYSRGPREPYLVGIGHRLSPAERRANNWQPTYSRTKIDQFFYSDLAKAIEASRRAFPSFDREPTDIQISLVNISFTCGATGVLRWYGLREAMARGDYGAAAREITNSVWRYQVQLSRVRAVREPFERMHQRHISARLDLTNRHSSD